jgi:hypothetical protein
MSRCRVLFGAACRQYNLRRSAAISSRRERSRGRHDRGRVGGVTFPARPYFETAISLGVIDREGNPRDRRFKEEEPRTEVTRL